MTSVNNNTKQRPNDDEIDLGTIFNGIKKLFNYLFDSLIIFFLKLRRSTIQYRYLLIGFVLVGLLFGYTNWITSKEYYKSTMLLGSEYFSGILVENGIEKLNLLTGEKDRQQLADILGVTKEVAEEIKSFEVEPFVSEEERVELQLLKEQIKGAGGGEMEELLNHVEIENRNTYQISVMVFDNYVIDKLTNPVVNYFRNNPYINKRIESNTMKLKARRSKYESEVEKLDSLKFVIFKNIESMAQKYREGSNNVVLAESMMENPLGIYQEGAIFFDKLLQVDEDLFLGSDFELIDGFTTFSKPENEDLRTVLALSVLISLGLAYMVIVLIQLNKYLSRLEKDKMERSTSALA